MKKITLLSFAFVALSLASCKKARTCTCNGTTTVTQTSTGTVNSTSSSSSPEAYVETLPSATKKTAKGKADCNSRVVTSSDSFTSGGTTTKTDVSSDITCTIK